ncbi:serpin family protein [Streptomyces sp. WM6378]|uniref:serpin family protein n=1 Tax=Streptomyces sp. WM6378 TaxID=1415557 RepID=UPI00099B38A4|nr:serpin family protein [Streptomyces sp. WM6378]
MCSPAGLWLALGVVAAGARTETADELRALLGVAGDEAADAVTASARYLAATDALVVATRAWARVPLYRAYRESLPGIVFGRVPDQRECDAWVREATGGLIEALPVTLDADTALAVVNVLALKARWERPFLAWSTRPCPFTDARGVEHEVATMHGAVEPADAWRAPGGVRVVELRTAGTGVRTGARVRFLLGPPGVEARDVLPAGWAEEREPLGADEIRLALPRLDLRTRLDVVRQLTALGVEFATDDELADFSGMSPEPLRVGQVVQEAVVKVAEEGIEAAAVTVAAMDWMGADEEPRRIERIAFDRPFGIVVLDATGEVPLFTAWQSSAPES